MNKRFSFLLILPLYIKLRNLSKFPIGEVAPCQRGSGIHISHCIELRLPQMFFSVGTDYNTPTTYLSDQGLKFVWNSASVTIFFFFTLMDTETMPAIFFHLSVNWINHCFFFFNPVKTWSLFTFFTPMQTGPMFIFLNQCKLDRYLRFWIQLKHKLCLTFLTTV